MLRFLVNPASGGGKAGRHLERIVRRAERLGAAVTTTGGGGEITRRARQAVAEGVDRLVVAGGDGSMHLAVQALAGSGCALGLLPLGRGNDLATSLGIPRGLAAALDLACQGPVRAIDLGRAGDRWFHCYGGAGFDSAVAETADRHPRWWPERLTYGIAVVRTLAGFRPPETRVEWDDGEFRGPVMFVTICNAPFFGGGMMIAPGAEMGDGRLDLVIVRRVSKGELLKVFPRVYRGDHVSHPAISVHRTRTVRLAFDRAISLGCDGEPAGVAGPEPVSFQVRPSALRVVAPA